MGFVVCVCGGGGSESFNGRHQVEKKRGLIKYDPLVRPTTPLKMTTSDVAETRKNNFK